ncbi:MAG: hypothetical protein KatS3mg105_0688 [Gemmatales bacterium]|nr:MAG: hypothetical protein KatS3mg105_0688 [Gemmatales bacterium]
MEFAVILVNWHDEEGTLRQVRALRSWKRLRPRLFVVDNGSTSVSRASLSGEVDRSELICSAVNRGYGGGNNLAIIPAIRQRVDALLLLNNDADISEAGAEALLERLASDSKIAILGPTIWEGAGEQWHAYAGGRDIALYQTTRIPFELGTVGSSPSNPLVAVDYVPGTVFFARREVFERTGLLDERYFFSGEIADFCARARRHGFRAFVDLQVQAKHDVGRTCHRLRNTLYEYYSLRNRFLYVTKHHRRHRLRLFFRWFALGMKRSMSALANGDLARAWALQLALRHAFLRRFGNQNHCFSRVLDINETAAIFADKKPSRQRLRLVFLGGTVGAGKTAVASSLQKRQPDVDVIDVDEMKRQHYGTTEVCLPDLDFAEAGYRAGRRHQPNVAIIVEPVCEREHFRSILDAAGLHEDDPNVRYVWLECSLATALERKKGVLDPGAIKAQYARYPQRFRPRGECVIITDNLTIDQAADRVWDVIRER